MKWKHALARGAWRGSSAHVHLLIIYFGVYFKSRSYIIAYLYLLVS